MPAPVTLAHVALLVVDSPFDTVIATSASGPARVCRRGELRPGEREVYSRQRLVAEGIGATPQDAQALADRLTAELSGWHLVA
ncbi:hypothetical protein [Nocardiopsis trehalosi]|uniref:hypothetical protein n=1 Tax=Nocardiopsis trehalosi TaxID=109329 RepID=UPI000835CDEC|nr:hypothetical protein [Nocardiopsis trehalosi]